MRHAAHMAALYLLLPSLLPSSCGSSVDEGGEENPNWRPLLTVDLDGIANMVDTETVRVDGWASDGPLDGSCCPDAFLPGEAAELTGITITARNRTTGLEASVGQTVSLSSMGSSCSCTHAWSAEMPVASERT